ncbi:MAG: hypothetical protein J6B11_05960 [Spirochaetales bacterium]|nr:hypothetical protein [Spirochaetales bacterium]
MQRNKVGIIGGLGYISTAEYYRKIIEKSMDYTKSNDYPELPLLLKDGDISIPVINTMELHIEETVRKLYDYI